MTSQEFNLVIANKKNRILTLENDQNHNIYAILEIDNQLILADTLIPKILIVSDNLQAILIGLAEIITDPRW